MLKIYFFRPLAFASELIGCLNPREKYKGSANQTAVGDACLGGFQLLDLIINELTSHMTC